MAVTVTLPTVAELPEVTNRAAVTPVTGSLKVALNTIGEALVHRDCELASVNVAS